MHIVVCRHLGQITNISEWAERSLGEKTYKMGALCTPAIGTFPRKHQRVLHPARSPPQDRSQRGPQDVL